MSSKDFLLLIAPPSKSLLPEYEIRLCEYSYIKNICMNKLPFLSSFCIFVRHIENDLSDTKEGYSLRQSLLIKTYILHEVPTRFFLVFYY